MVVTADDTGAFSTLVSTLVRGGVAIAPGDTMYGMLGIAPRSDARIRRIKGRGEEKPFLLLLAERSWAARLSDMEVPAPLAKYWPGPLTVVLSARGGGSVAVRVPDSPFLRELLKAVGEPLYSTSVNRAGGRPLATIAAMRREFETEVDLVYDAGDFVPGPPSTLVDATMSPFKVLRQGALVIAAEDLA
jgi:L-threonylcarbamoyladenylate synthase